MKIITITFLYFFLIISFSSVFAECSFSSDSNKTVSDMLTEDCKPNGSITGGDFVIAWGVKEKVVRITNQIILGGSILSVGGIVFAAILYISALGDGEKVKKAKTALQFSVLWFVVMLISFPLVNAIINLIYGISGT